MDNVSESTGKALGKGLIAGAAACGAALFFAPGLLLAGAGAGLAAAGAYLHQKLYLGDAEAVARYRADIEGELGLSGGMTKFGLEVLLQIYGDQEEQQAGGGAAAADAAGNNQDQQQQQQQQHPATAAERLSALFIAETDNSFARVTASFTVEMLQELIGANVISHRQLEGICLGSVERAQNFTTFFHQLHPERRDVVLQRFTGAAATAAMEQKLLDEFYWLARDGTLLRVEEQRLGGGGQQQPRQRQQHDGNEDDVAIGAGDRQNQQQQPHQQPQQQQRDEELQNQQDNLMDMTVDNRQREENEQQRQMAIDENDNRFARVDNRERAVRANAAADIAAPANDAAAAGARQNNQHQPPQPQQQQRQDQRARPEPVIPATQPIGIVRFIREVARFAMARLNIPRGFFRSALETSRDGLDRRLPDMVTDGLLDIDSVIPGCVRAVFVERKFDEYVAATTAVRGAAPSLWVAEEQVRVAELLAQRLLRAERVDTMFHRALPDATLAANEASTERSNIALFVRRFERVLHDERNEALIPAGRRRGVRDAWRAYDAADARREGRIAAADEAFRRLESRHSRRAGRRRASGDDGDDAAAAWAEVQAARSDRDAQRRRAQAEFDARLREIQNVFATGGEQRQDAGRDAGGGGGCAQQ